jgi:hypothetical protein
MYREYAERMNQEKSAGGRKIIIEDVCRLFGVSQAKAYKEMAAHGWESGRKKRRDAGSSDVPPETLAALASLIKKGLRKNGKATMPINVARSILEENGYIINASDSRLRDLLRQQNMAIRDAKVPSPHQRMRSDYPNQVHFTDPSVSLIWFAPGGKQKIIGDDEQYKNKNFLEGKLKCWRYVLTDHCSSYICVRYYAAKGETAVNMYDFLLYAWGLKDDPLYAFHGLPEMLIWDCGSANISKPVTKALEALRVKTFPHLPGNPRAKGQVEKANDIVETQFESRLRIEPVNSIDELNDAAERWCAAFNANMVPGLDSRLARRGEKIGARLMLWQRIGAEQLRELPDPDICRQIFTTGTQVRKVAGDLSVSLTHPRVKRVMRYSLADLPGVLVGLEVNVQPVLVDEEPLVKVSYEYQREEVSFEVEPIAYDESGFDLDAPVFGKEYKREPDTIREKAAKDLAQIAATDAGGMEAHSFINASSPFIKPRTGEQITIAQPDRVSVHEIFISHFEALRRVSARIGYTPDGFIDQMKKEYPEGIPSSRIDDIATEYEAGADSARLSL